MDQPTIKPRNLWLMGCGVMLLTIPACDKGEALADNTQEKKPSKTNSSASTKPDTAKAKSPDKPKYRGLLGVNSRKVKREGDKTFIYAGGKPGSAEAVWYDFTGSPIDPAELQFGIGKDRILAIDDPVYVQPDDPRLMSLPVSYYRKNERPTNNNEIMVCGYVVGSEARAYPVSLLDHHELVNDVIGGKPVTIGW